MDEDERKFTFGDVLRGATLLVSVLALVATLVMRWGTDQQVTAKTVASLESISAILVAQGEAQKKIAERLGEHDIAISVHDVKIASLYAQTQDLHRRVSAVEAALARQRQRYYGQEDDRP